MLQPGDFPYPTAQEQMMLTDPYSAVLDEYRNMAKEDRDAALLAGLIAGTDVSPVLDAYPAGEAPPSLVMFRALFSWRLTRKLIDLGCDVGVQDRKGNGLVGIAVSNANVTVDTLGLLLSAGADITHPVICGDEPVLPARYAARALRADKLALLLCRGADATRPDEMGRSLLHYAADALFGQDDAAASAFRVVLPLLLRHGVSVNSIDARGQTPLHVAAQRPEPQRLLALLAEGADPSMADRQGMRPVDHACENRCAENAHLLQSALARRHMAALL